MTPRDSAKVVKKDGFCAGDTVQGVQSRAATIAHAPEQFEILTADSTISTIRGP